MYLHNQRLLIRVVRLDEKVKYKSDIMIRDTMASFPFQHVTMVAQLETYGQKMDIMIAIIHYGPLAIVNNIHTQ